MKVVELKKSELREVNRMIDQYRKIENELSAVLEKLQELENDKNHYIEELDKTKESESSFFKVLEKKYGKGRIDLHTMKYVVT